MHRFLPLLVLVACNPGASQKPDEAACDGVLQSSETTVDSPFDLDGDGAFDKANADCADTYSAAELDCDDGDPDVNPGAQEVCDGIDNDCNSLVDDLDPDTVFSTFWADGDGDGYGDPNVDVLSCAAPEGFVADDQDCDDGEAAVNPGASEVCDGVDNNCDGEVDEGLDLQTWYFDGDGDGYGLDTVSTEACARPEDYTSAGGDCDDRDPAINPDARDDCDGVDNDCDGEIDDAASTTWYRDADRDGWGDASVTEPGCSAPVGYTDVSGDCDDGDPAINPDAREVCDGVDNNCDGEIDDAASTTWYRDADRDGWGDASVTELGCSEPAGYTDVSGDCDDTTAAVSPGVAETCDGIDDDCDGEVDEDDVCGGGSKATLCGGANTDDTYDDGSSMGGPGLHLAMQYSATSALSVCRVEVFTGEASGTNTISIWTSAAAGTPATELAEGSWTMSSTDGWQGADLASTVDLVAGTSYWVVWEPINGSQSSFSTSGTSVRYYGSWDGSSWFGPYSGYLKFALYCC
jgi:large repetitive protein